MFDKHFNIPLETAANPSVAMERARMVAVVVPSPACSFVLFATSWWAYIQYLLIVHTNGKLKVYQTKQ